MGVLENLNKYQIILGSGSPRRKELLEDMGVNFSVEKPKCDENYPDGLDNEEIPKYIAIKKAHSFKEELKNNQLIITADTIVYCEDKILQKPIDRADAIDMLGFLSDKVNYVVTGVCLLTKEFEKSFIDISKSYFTKLQRSEIEYYVDKYEPYDKSGSHGLQEWIGMVGIKKIEGSVFNIVGLPTQKLYEVLKGL